MKSAPATACTLLPPRSNAPRRWRETSPTAQGLSLPLLLLLMLLTTTTMRWRRHA
jgi:hypothetical protein